MTLELLKKLKTQKEVSKKLGKTEANISQTIKRAKRKIINSKATLKHAKEKGYLPLLSINEDN
jgi:transcriptional regulator